MSYFRDDPDAHLAEIAAALELPGPGVGLMTGVDVAERVIRTDAGVEAVATVGSRCTGVGRGARRRPAANAIKSVQPGTINVVVRVPVRLSEAALVNAVATVAEAKAQALWEIGVEATGTASDATCVSCAPDGPAEPYGGPRSDLGRPDRPSRVRGRP